jgi:hypothetical protein
MADSPPELVGQAEQDVAGGDYRSAVKALERAYVPVQRPRDIETIDRALTLARRIATEGRAEGRDRRKAQRIAGWYETLVWDAAHAPVREGPRAAAGASGPPSLAWIDGLIAALGGFVVLVLAAGFLVAAAAATNDERIASIAGAAFWATMLLALIAVLRLLQAIERNTAPAASPSESV